ncbi:MAG: hypothetical protein MHPSP_000675 [Paramarteilia canceri]
MTLPALSHLIMPESFQMRQRILGSNIPGDQQICIALTRIKGIGRPLAVKFCSQANISPYQLAGSLKPNELEHLEKTCQESKIPTFYMNCRKERKTGQSLHKTGPALETHLKSNFDLQLRLKRHRIVRSTKNLKIRGQRTKANGRHRRQM